MRRYPLSLCLLALLLSACYREPVYPPLLTEADSAFVSGDYTKADSLLAVYDSQTIIIEAQPEGKRHLTRSERAIGNFRLLLGLEQKFVRGNLTEDDFSAADSLSRYYDNKGTREKQARALLFLGDVYKLSDYPSALSCYLQAESLVQQMDCPIVKMWTLGLIGDLYFDQRMLNECKSYYRQYYQLFNFLKFLTPDAIGIRQW